MSNIKLTKRQKEILNILNEEKAFNITSGYIPFGIDYKIFENLTIKGILNNKNDLFWIRQENEKETGIYYCFIVYGQNILIDNKNYYFIICKANKKYPFKYIDKGLLKLAKSLNITRYKMHFDGYELESFENTKFPKFEFNGTEFIKK